MDRHRHSEPELRMQCARVRAYEEFVHVLVLVESRAEGHWSASDWPAHSTRAARVSVRVSERVSVRVSVNGKRRGERTRARARRAARPSGSYTLEHITLK